MWITSMGNHGAAGGISECRHSSCSSLLSSFLVYSFLFHSSLFISTKTVTLISCQFATDFCALICIWKHSTYLCAAPWPIHPSHLHWVSIGTLFPAASGELWVMATVFNSQIQYVSERSLLIHAIHFGKISCVFMDQHMDGVVFWMISWVFCQFWYITERWLSNSKSKKKSVTYL